MSTLVKALAEIKSYRQGIEFNNNYVPKTVANNTTAHRHYSNVLQCWTVLIQYHRNPIIQYTEHGEIYVSTSGWTTYTTIQRLNQFTPDSCTFWRRNHQAWMSTPCEPKPITFGGQSWYRAV